MEPALLFHLSANMDGQLKTVSSSKFQVLETGSCEPFVL